MFFRDRSRSDGVFKDAGKSELLMEELKRSIKRRALEKSADEVEIKVSALGREAGAVGAARLMSETVLDRLYRGN